MARSLVARLPRCVDVQDLVHAGLWGLVQAIEKFRPERGTDFLPFMRQRVRGAMLDELRTMDYLPRLWRWRQRTREAAIEDLRARLHRDPTDAEIAEALGISEDRLRSDFNAPVDVHRPGSRAFGFGADEDDPLEVVVDDRWERPFDALAGREMIERIRTSLQPIEWEVLKLHYLEGLSGKEVAQRLRLSASRICQIHARVLSRLKTRLGRG
jgi:RNA polymerase sigma factor for flagellar operon FliA